MKGKDFQVSISVDATPQEAFNSINNVTGWWTENMTGSSKKLNDEFSVRFGDVHYSKQKLVEVIPGKRVVWLVTESALNFVKDQQEWNNTKINFDIAERDGKTQIHFTHVGLVPEVECYNGCSNAWGDYIRKSLFKLITEGKGVPALKEVLH